MSDYAPIAAIATAPGRGGIGAVRVSGGNLSPLMLRLFKRVLTPRHAHYLPFTMETGEVLDEGIAIFFQGPNSYTGEDVLELQGHGGPAVLRRGWARSPVRIRHLLCGGKESLAQLAANRRDD